MSISSSLNAGVMGLNSNASRLSTISDNIANSSTYGYKRSVADFSSMVIEKRAAAYSAGGVKVNTFKDISATGSLITTGSSTDMAVAGRGLLPVTDASGVNTLSSERELMLLPTGSFYADESGNLRTQSGMFLLGWAVDSEGGVGNVSRNSGSSLTPVNISASQYLASPTTRVDLGINLPADATLAGGLGEPYQLPIEYFDNLGRSQTLTMSFTPTVPETGSTNQWTVQIFDSASGVTESIGGLGLTFDDSVDNGGRLAAVSADTGTNYNAETGVMTLALPHGNVEVFLGKAGGKTGITQLSAPFSPTNVNKDGAPIGDLESVEIDEKGYLQAVYNSGFRRALYQIPVGDVPNMNGLQAKDAQAFSVSADSGNLYLWDAGTGPVGDIAGYSLMESTTDIAAELTDLIETQRAYSSNAKIVQTVDEMLQETTNLKR